MSQEPAPADQQPSTNVSTLDKIASETPKQAVVPERPKLAPGIKLIGQMKETAFVNPPWLVEREGAGYLQVTELLFHVAEQCDGTKTIDEIAASLVADGHLANTQNISQMIASALMPTGIVAGADGSIPEAAAPHQSLLAVNLHISMMSPRLIDPVTKILKTLFWPPILVLVLVVAAAAQAWLFLIHGIGQSIHDVVYQPGIMAALLLVMLVSAGFHEFGHASALRYGGGKVRGMGAGFYMAFPAFYTDVTDNYKLGRWARVRTDLGGFYFNLIFSIGIIGAYMLTHAEPLLLVVVLIDVEIIHQFLPFIRLDGYWALADITGIPDFFSQMGGFLRSILPVPSWKGQKLADLKWWAKLVFALYIIIVIPVLGGIIYFMVKGFPRVMATAWDSFSKLISQFPDLAARGDVLGILGVAFQILMLGISSFGVAFMLYTLAKLGLTLLWRWARPTPGRRVIGAIGTLAAAAVVAFLWAPTVPFGLFQPGTVAASSQYTPIGNDEQWTVPQAVGVNQVNIPVISNIDPPRPEEQSVQPTAAATPPAVAAQPVGSPAISGTAAPAVSPAAQATPTGAATQTPATSPSPSASPSAATSPTSDQSTQVPSPSVPAALPTDSAPVIVPTVGRAPTQSGPASTPAPAIVQPAATNTPIPRPTATNVPVPTPTQPPASVTPATRTASVTPVRTPTP